MARWTREGLQKRSSWQTCGGERVRVVLVLNGLLWLLDIRRSLTLCVGWLEDHWQPPILFQRELSFTVLHLLLCPFLSWSSIGRHWDVAADAMHCRHLAGSSSKATFLCNRELDWDQPQICLFTSAVVFFFEGKIENSYQNSAKLPISGFDKPNG